MTESRVCKRCGISKELTSENFRLRNGRTFEWVCKVCGRKRTHDNYVENKTERRLSAKERYYANLEKERTRSREAMRKIRLDPVKHAKQLQDHKAYYQRNKIRILKNVRDRYQLQAPIRRLGARNRYARRKGVNINYSPDEIKTLFIAQKGKCWWCGKPITNEPYGFDIDHRIPLSRGGSNATNNLVLTCPHCNRSKQDKLPHEWTDRLL